MGNVEVAYDNFVDTLNAAKLIVLRENDSTTFAGQVFYRSYVLRHIRLRSSAV